MKLAQIPGIELHKDQKLLQHLALTSQIFTPSFATNLAMKISLSYALYPFSS
ncbi:hypothetical protein FDUTEX481_02817 [Tolypothrix sp. PCC 7601]|nr:hypothetical protein FDUTEX481_02817 [Tolypothrix sp. PCC 7601]